MSKQYRNITIASHIIWTNYGTWLPNDPRGSTSREVYAPSLQDLGELHEGRKRIQPRPTIVREFYSRVGSVLKYPIFRFDGKLIEIVGRALGEEIRSRGYTCYACAVMPDHVHLLIRKHRDSAETIRERLQAATRHAVLESNREAIHHEHPIWTRGGFEKFVASVEAMRNVIRYIANNPTKASLSAQLWNFVQEYDNWPFHKT